MAANVEVSEKIPLQKDMENLDLKSTKDSSTDELTKRFDEMLIINGHNDKIHNLFKPLEDLIFKGTYKGLHENKDTGTLRSNVKVCEKDPLKKEMKVLTQKIQTYEKDNKILIWKGFTYRMDDCGDQDQLPRFLSPTISWSVEPKDEDEGKFEIRNVQVFHFHPDKTTKYHYWVDIILEPLRQKSTQISSTEKLEAAEMDITNEMDSIRDLFKHLEDRKFTGTYEGLHENEDTGTKRSMVDVPKEDPLKEEMEDLSRRIKTDKRIWKGFTVRSNSKENLDWLPRFFSPRISRRPEDEDKGKFKIRNVQEPNKGEKWEFKIYKVEVFRLPKDKRFKYQYGVNFFLEPLCQKSIQ